MPSRWSGVRQSMPLRNYKIVFRMCSFRDFAQLKTELRLFGTIISKVSVEPGTEGASRVVAVLTGFRSRC